MGSSRVPSFDVASLTPRALRRFERLHSEVSHSTVGICFGNLKLLAGLYPERADRSDFLHKLQEAYSHVPDAQREVLRFFEARVRRGLTVADCFPKQARTCREALSGLAELSRSIQRDALREAPAGDAESDSQSIPDLARLTPQHIDSVMAALGAVRSRVRGLRVDVVELVARTVELHRLRCEEAGIELRFDSPQGRVAKVHARAGRLDTVVSEFIENAVRYAFVDLADGRDRVIAIRVEATGKGPDFVDIVVEDSGSGGGEATAATAVAPGLSHGMDGGAGGGPLGGDASGEGLRIARRIVEREHGGSLESRYTDSGGWRVRVSLPVRDMDTAPSGEQKPRSSARRSPLSVVERSLRRLGVPRRAIERLLEKAQGLAAREGVGHSGADGWSQSDLSRTLARGLLDEVSVLDVAVSERQEATRVLILVGPTGVGKTTTIAKLAGHFAIHKGQRVGLVATDTFRVGAVEQLREYASILQAPYQVASDGLELRRAIEGMVDCDVVLVDTVGSSPRDVEKIQAIERLVGVLSDCPAGGFVGGPGNSSASNVAGGQTVEVFLVLSATSTHNALRTAVREFSLSGRIRGLIATKLDEVDRLGCLLAMSELADRPLAWLTFGQNVPEDLAPAEAERLARAIMLGRFPRDS